MTEKQDDEVYCRSCGELIGINSAYCEHCGAKNVVAVKQSEGEKDTGSQEVQEENQSKQRERREERIEQKVIVDENSKSQQNRRGHSQVRTQDNKQSQPQVQPNPANQQKQYQGYEEQESFIDKIAPGMSWAGVVLMILLAMGTITESVSGMPERMAVATIFYLALAAYCAPPVRSRLEEEFDVTFSRPVVVVILVIGIVVAETIAPPLADPPFFLFPPIFS